ncbi:MAG: type II toxin-antitoxin system RelB/DinJ family antitoxin [Firmicutes bacterium]|nr:type II toxin-antitoxin system RelB/DinJ family antitoxin [Bacillota bacterium]
MQQSLTTIKLSIDNEIKQQAEEILSTMDLDINKLLNITLRQLIQDKTMPFLPTYKPLKLKDDIMSAIREAHEHVIATGFSENHINEFLADDRELHFSPELTAEIKAAHAKAIEGHESEYMTEEEIDALIEKSMNEDREGKLQARKDFCEGIRRIQAQSVINGTDKMTMDEIDAIIAEVRAEMRAEETAGIK